MFLKKSFKLITIQIYIIKMDSIEDLFWTFLDNFRTDQ